VGDVAADRGQGAAGDEQPAIAGAFGAAAGAADDPEHAIDARRPPAERQVGEAWRHGQIAADQPTGDQDARRPPTEAQVGESWRHPVTVPVRPADPGGQPGWLIVVLGVLAGVLALAGGLVVLAARRASRKVPAGQTG
jgi:hypothetical protein